MQDAHAIAIQHDWDVYTNDGEHLGTAKTVTDTYVVVEKGHIFKHDLYMPVSSFYGGRRDGASGHALGHQRPD